MMFRWIRAATTAVAAVALSTTVAAAQLIQYSTSGVFTGALCGGAPASCNIGAATLTYQGVTNAAYLGFNSAADFGIFVLGSANGTSSYTGASFTLTITQSQPSAGSQTVSGSIGGTLMFQDGASSGGLFWVPNARTFSIGAVQYEIYVDNNGRFNIASPTQNFNPDRSTMRGSVNVIPEPSTVLLLGSGIAGLGLFGLRARRRESTTD